MKRSTSDWDLEEFLWPVESSPPSGVADGNGSRRNPLAALETLLIHWEKSNKPMSGVGGGVVDEGNISVTDVFSFSDPDTPRSHSLGGPLTESQIWSQNRTALPSSISPTIETQSSICAESPTSSLNPKHTPSQARGRTSDSESDEESFETEAGLYEQSAGTTDLKSMRRMVSNRESARRSRKRKQAHLTDLELQVVKVPGCFEISVVAQRLGKSGSYDAVLCIGAVIRGDTTHYDAVANSAASGVLNAGLNSGVPCVFGVLTYDNMEQGTFLLLHRSHKFP